MVRVQIPESEFVMGQPVAVTVLKFSVEHGPENGLVSFPLGKQIKTEIDDIEMEYPSIQNFNPRKGMKIVLIQE